MKEFETKYKKVFTCDVKEYCGYLDLLFSSYRSNYGDQLGD